MISKLGHGIGGTTSQYQAYHDVHRIINKIDEIIIVINNLLEKKK